MRSGGHGFRGSNNVAAGVTIDLSRMNGSAYDAATNTARIQPGGRWRDVYADLEREGGVTVTGGRDGDVGVGGFLLGGGNSFFSGEMGFGCDTVVNYEVVLADGSVVNANAGENADLWRALKGGGSNFGIITRFDLEALPSRKLYRELRTVSAGGFDALVDAVTGFADMDRAVLEHNHLITFIMRNASVIPEPYAGAIYVNTQGQGNVSTAFDGLRDVPALANSTSLQTMAEAAFASQLPGGTR